MQQFILENDVHVLCVAAKTFPTGIMEAFNKLHSIVPDADKRDSYGISRGSKDGVIYKAAAQQLKDGEAEQYGCETYVMKKGTYTGTILKDWKKDEKGIGRTFRELLANPGIDPDGACIEKYMGDDVQCMIRLKDM